VLAWVCVGLSGGGSISHAAGPQHDVFERPKPRLLKQHQAETVNAEKPAPAPVEWKPELRAIISGGGTAWVNVEGRILKVGQDMDGFRLVEVQERRAVFVKDDVRYALDLQPVKGASRATPGAAGKSVADAVVAAGGKGAADVVAGADGTATASGAAGKDGKAAPDAVSSPGGKSTAEALSNAGSKRADEPASSGGGSATDRVPIGTIKSSAILPRPAPSAGGFAGSLAEARGR
jgi:hypothetical protein